MPDGTGDTTGVAPFRPHAGHEQFDWRGGHHHASDGVRCTPGDGYSGPAAASIDPNRHEDLSATAQEQGNMHHRTAYTYE